jgi:hypothetical protein
MRLEVKEHFTDEIAGKTYPDLALKTVIIPAEYVCFKKPLDFFQRHENLACVLTIELYCDSITWNFTS